MRGRRWVFALAVGVGLTAGSCTKGSQPLQAVDQTMLVRFHAQATMDLYDVWDTEKVTTTTIPGQNPNVLIEPVGLWCEGPVGHVPDTNYPVQYAVEISRIAAGTSEETLLTGANYRDKLASVTSYDDAEGPSGTHSPDWVQVLSQSPTTSIVLHHRNGVRVSTGNRTFLKKLKIPAEDPIFASKCPLGGQDNQKDFGDPAVAGHPDVFSLTVKRGDTIIVRARKDLNPVQSALFLPGTLLFKSIPSVNGTLPAFNGRTDSTQGTDQGIVYAYTYR